MNSIILGILLNGVFGLGLVLSSMIQAEANRFILLSSDKGLYWSEANESCERSFGTQLVTTTSSNDKDIMQTLLAIPHMKNKGVWVSSKAGRSNQQKCAQVMLRNDDQMELTDIECSTKLYYWICEPKQKQEQRRLLSTCLLNSTQIVDWNQTFANNDPSVLPYSELVTAFDPNFMTLSTTAKLKYVVRSKFGDQTDLGVTWVIDTYPFTFQGNSISTLSICSNKASWAYVGKDFSEWWTYSLDPVDLGSINNLEYGPPNDGWTLSLVDANEPCNLVQYQKVWSLSDLEFCGFEWDITSATDAILFGGSIQVSLVSPMDQNSDTGNYFVYNTRSVEVLLKFFKFSTVLGSIGIADIILFGQSIIQIVSVRSTESINVLFRTLTPPYMYYNIDPNTIYLDRVSPVPHGWTINKASFQTGNCYLTDSYHCMQLWELTANISGLCTSDTGVVDLSFDPSYLIRFESVCTSTDVNSFEYSQCAARYAQNNNSHNFLTTFHLDYESDCALIFRDFTFDGQITVYSDNFQTVRTTPVFDGDTLFVRSTYNLASGADQVLDIVVPDISVCTVTNDEDLTIVNGLGGCLTDNRVDWRFELMTGGNINGNPPPFEFAVLSTSGNSVDFKLKVPPLIDFAHHRKLFIQTKAVLTVQSAVTRRRIMLTIPTTTVVSDNVGNIAIEESTSTSSNHNTTVVIIVVVVVSVIAMAAVAALTAFIVRRRMHNRVMDSKEHQTKQIQMPATKMQDADVAAIIVDPN